MPPDDRFKPRRGRTRPPETEIPSDILQAVGERREVNPSVDERQAVGWVGEGDSALGALAGSAIAFAHAFKENGLVAAVAYDPRIGDPREDSQKFLPYPLLSVRVIGPKAVL